MLWTISILALNRGDRAKIKRVSTIWCQSQHIYLSSLPFVTKTFKKSKSLVFWANALQKGVPLLIWKNWPIPWTWCTIVSNLTREAFLNKSSVLLTVRPMSRLAMTIFPINKKKKNNTTPQHHTWQQWNAKTVFSSTISPTRGTTTQNTTNIQSNVRYTWFNNNTLPLTINTQIPNRQHTIYQLHRWGGPRTEWHRLCWLGHCTQRMQEEKHRLRFIRRRRHRTSWRIPNAIARLRRRCSMSKCELRF